ncbi:MAG: tetratricopeptide repeat protein [Promethearchaeota archaeon]
MEKQPIETSDLNYESSILSEENKAKISHYLQLVSQDPSDIEVWTNLGLLFIQTRNYNKSIECLNSALSIIASEQEEGNILRKSKLQNALGVAYFQLGEYSKAEEYFESVLSIDNNNKDVLNNLGILHTRTGKTKDAINSLLKVLEIDDTDIHAWENLAELYRLLGEYDESLRCRMRVLELSDIK